MIKSIRLKNYKSFKDTKEIKLAPITIFVGENNSGKSSILHAINMLSMTAHSNDPIITLKLLNEEYDYGSFEDIVHDQNTKNKLNIEVKGVYEQWYRENEEEDQEATLSFTFRYLSRRKEIFLEDYKIKNSSKMQVQIKSDPYSKRTTIIPSHQKDLLKYISIERNGLEFSFYYDWENAAEKFDNDELEFKTDFYWELNQAARDLLKSLKDTHHLGPIRQNLERSYIHSGELATRIGSKGQFALQVYSTLLNRNTKESRNSVSLINNSLFKLGFIKSLDKKTYGLRHYEFWGQHKKSDFTANIADTGFGASQVLPVLVSLFADRNKSLHMFEQPEIHLHPSAQAELGSIFVEAANLGKRVVLETHSENLILRIQTEIAKGNIDNSNVAIYYVSAGKSQHKIKEIKLGDDGEFLTEWPSGFFEENYIESLKLMQARRKKNNANT